MSIRVFAGNPSTAVYDTKELPETGGVCSKHAARREVKKVNGEAGHLSDSGVWLDGYAGCLKYCEFIDRQLDPFHGPMLPVDAASVETGLRFL